MTKEEILDKREHQWISDDVEMEDDTALIPRPQCLIAMDEYAKQEAIEFAEYIHDNYWIREPFPRKDTGKTMWAIYSEGEKPDSLKTTEQLYNLFLKSKFTISKKQ